MTRIVFWQNLLAFYQAPHIQALASHGNHSVVWVAQEALSRNRQLQGWSLPSVSGVEIYTQSDLSTIQHLASVSPENSVHIFTGISAFPMVYRAFKECLRVDTCIGLLTEKRDDRGWKGLARLLRYRYEYYRYGAKIDFALIMGYTGEHGGRNWYRRCGYPDEKLFPYGYFPCALRSPAKQSASVDEVELIYIGQCIPRKGVDLLLKALSLIRHRNWRLKIIGDGRNKNKWQLLSQNLSIADRVEFWPSLPNMEAIGLLSRSDLFILPSRFDGWGVVVNEALLCGVPVICSDRCGAMDLLQESWRGEVFESGNISSLMNALERRISRGKTDKITRERIKEWATCISGHTASLYLQEILDHIGGKTVRPETPWFTTRELSQK